MERFYETTQKVARLAKIGSDPYPYIGQRAVGISTADRLKGQTRLAGGWLVGFRPEF